MGKGRRVGLNLLEEIEFSLRSQENLVRKLTQDPFGPWKVEDSEDPWVHEVVREEAHVDPLAREETWQDACRVEDRGVQS